MRETGCPRHRVEADRRRRTEGFDILGLPSRQYARHDATAVLVIGVAIAAIGTGFSVYSQLQQAQAQSAMLRYNQRVAEMQAEFAQKAALQNALQAQRQAEMAQAAAAFDAGLQEENAKLALEANEYEKQIVVQESIVAANAAKIEEEDARRALDRVQSTSRSLIAKSGVEVEGSPLLVMMENAAETDIAVSRIRYGTALRDHAVQNDLRAMDYSAKLRERGALAEAGRIRMAGSMEASALRGEAARIRYAGELQAWGFNVEGAMAGYQRRAVNSALPFQLGSTLLTGVGRGVSLYGDYRAARR